MTQQKYLERRSFHREQIGDHFDEIEKLLSIEITKLIRLLKAQGMGEKVDEIFAFIADMASVTAENIEDYIDDV